MDFGVILDVETTGMDPAKDAIIEIGLLEFSFVEGKDPMITRMYGALEDPGADLSPEIESITGIKTEFLKGQKINWQYVREILEHSSVIIAHNMKFDRGFILARPELKGVGTHWACSCADISWKEKGFKSARLNYLAADHGFVNPFAHRALFDCATTFRLISKHLMELTENSYAKKIRVDAVQAPFDKKDILKDRGYRWEADRRVWCKVLLEKQLPEEREFLMKQVYLGATLHKEVEEKN